MVAFVQSFDPTKPLEDQLDFPLEFSFKSRKLKLEARKGKNTGFYAQLIKLNHRGHHRPYTRRLRPLEATYLAILIKDGYVTQDELLIYVHNSTSEANLPLVRACGLRKKLGKRIIKTRKSSPDYCGGYYVGELKDCRNEKPNLRSFNGVSCNVITGYVSLSNGYEAYLTPLETRILDVIIRSRNRGVSMQSIKDNVIDINGPTDTTYDNITVHVCHINRKLGEQYIVRKDSLFVVK